MFVIKDTFMNCNVDWQKFRLYLKRISGVAQQQNSISGPVESNMKLGGLGRFGIQALAATGHVPPETLAALHAELYGHPAGNVISTMDQTALLQASIHGSKHYPAEHGVAYGQPLVKCPSNVSKSFPQGILTVDDASPAYGAWPPSNTVGSLGPNSILEGAGPQHNNMMDTLQHQHQQRQLPQQMQQQQLQHQSTIHDQSRSINVQPSCLVVPSKSSGSLPAGNRHASVNQNSRFGRNPFIDYSLFSPQSNDSSLNVAQFPDGEINGRGVLSRYNSPSTISPSASLGPLNTDNSNTQQLQNSALTLGSLKQFPTGVPNISDTQGLYCTGSGDALGQGALRNLGFVGKGTSIPSRFAAHEIESSMNEFSQGNISVDSNGNTVKEEPNIDFVDNSKGGFPAFRRY
ncbi:hypothetical protein L6164_001472 [Bauhinia variegata]|uniref:Uncharacterized protein n=1 Tax=Bauhinia variegata TaxID=167791 RepID=A0ACB9QBU6_BAUVA|nr:hypothetical protein L6164_001472 [Bauhinia variegata]